ncbi:helix-turn-helix domain-containing protein [Peribacillus sp. TH24]|uniref:helix-turn-helix domain-containing protein n=1 Tax=Peribacillus sp. TH24 TaxID=2798483 RepID=UPI0019135CC4|nr:helix-turn-helix transcriptional regulator [Peribacillus sp. TH24]MBK5447092.1 helix-turn-helix transcriptional regulator [Peribacillus sp. TH24]MBK5447105.1 helix-turn-helix transcriptional regulator [Peribacillus sp. TH24]
MELGDKLKRLRKEHSYSQNQLADKLHVTAQAISKWENNKSVPDIINLVQLSDLYNVSLDYLIKSDKELQSKLSIDNIRLKTFKYFVLSIALVITIAIFILIKAQFFMFQHGLGTWIFIGCTLLFIISVFLSLYCYIVKKNHFIFFWTALFMLSCIVFLSSFYDYIIDVLF